MPNFFLVVEGLSGCGKTTIGEELAARTKSVFYKTPPTEMGAMRQWVDQTASLTVRYLFYLISVLQSSMEIEKILQKHSVVCDRYLLTTECYHKVIGVNTFGGYDRMKHLILVPDITILVACSEKERQRRLYTRGLSFNDAEEEKLQISKLFYEEYKIHPVTEIDNSGNIEDAIKSIMDELQTRSLWRG